MKTAPEAGSNWKIVKEVNRRVSRLICIFLLGSVALNAHGQDWFERFKSSASNEELHDFLYAMPKGGDLHQHMSGSIFPEWFYDAAMTQTELGHRYYVKQKINNCETAMFGPEAQAYLLLNMTVDQQTYEKLSRCEQAEYTPLEQLSDTARTRWMNSLILDQPHEGRDEFFERHWPRMFGIARNVNLVADVFAENVKAFAAEGLSYLEPQIPIFGFVDDQGAAISPQRVLQVYLDRLDQSDVKKTGIEVRMQVSLLRFLPDAEAQLKVLYRFAHDNDAVVAVNMVGREDNDKGYPLRFLQTLRELRKKYDGVNLSIHAGEVDEPNHHIRDTLLLGAQRIGHGVNLITDPQTLQAMRYGPYLVEVNLISNLLLEYVSDYSTHPFPEYLRLGVPVALSTDDRGMWDSIMTDEFFVAVREFDLSWAEVKQLSRNSLRYAFVDEATRTRLLADYDARIGKFERAFQRRGAEFFEGQTTLRRGFICRRYEVCE